MSPLTPNDLRHARWSSRGKRPVRIANCAGSKDDPGYQMFRQITRGDVDVVTGDYLAEMNLAEHAETHRIGEHPGYELKAWNAFQQSIDAIAERGVKVVTNGGALNPRALAQKIHDLISEKGYDLKVGFVSGDDKFGNVCESVRAKKELPNHLDAANPNITHVEAAKVFSNPQASIVSANAYLGARAIVKGLESGLDIIICGRVADASPVIAAAWYWHSWKDTDYDALAGALVAGHLIECSAYVTGANFAGFYDYGLESLIDLSFGIAEVDKDGSCVITKHENTNGMVTEETVKCQFLYELQGDIYLNSDVKAYLSDVNINQVDTNRVRVTGVRGAPPPSTTKLAIFYTGGYESQLLLNAAGYATKEKWDLYEKQIKFGLQQIGALDKFDVLDFQIVGTPQENPRSLLKSTTYLRLFSQAPDQEPLVALLQTISDFAMQHFSGFHLSLDLRTAPPRPFLSFFPGLIPQSELKESINSLGQDGSIESTVSAGHPPKYEDLEPRDNYDPVNPSSLTSFGPTRLARLGDVVLARSGDKGANLNIGLFVREVSAWEWFRSFMTRARMIELSGEDWKDEFFLERVEFPKLSAVHFVIYGILGKGVSGSAKLDSLGKAYGDYIRDKWVDIPVSYLLSPSSA